MSRNKRIHVSLHSQKLVAYEGPTKIFEFDCVTGDKDHPTDIGTFQVFQKDRTHFSSKYKVQMDYALFFTKDGKAIHKSHAVGVGSYLKYLGIDSIGSHGCVRLTEEDAKALFEWTPMHTTVVVSLGGS